jgi:hypothetical protein
MENTFSPASREYCNNEAYKYEALEKMIRTEVIPHVGDDPRRKRCYLASSQDATTDSAGCQHRRRDSYICKRINAPALFSPT